MMSTITHGGRMPVRPKLQCPQCGSDMNFHAQMVREPQSAAEAAKVDPRLGGVLSEFHACPGCGASAARISD
jgi:ribosomal protein S27AE